MEYRDFGNTGVEVSKLGFGAMRLPGEEKDGKWLIDEDKSIEIYKNLLLSPQPIIPRQST